MKLKTEPVTIGAVIIALVGVASALGLSNVLAASLTGLTTAVVGLFIRQSVAPIPHVVAATTKAATEAATATAAQLTSTTVGAVGEVTDTALDVVDGVKTIATSTALRAIGIKRKDLVA